MPQIFELVPWGHHIRIVSKSNTLEEALFYINKTIEGNWSRGTLEDNIKHNLYSRSGKAITNYTDKLPVAQGQLAKDMLKDPYSFDFLTDNPSVGLIICKSYDKTIVEWSFNGIDKPLGVAAYQIQEVVDRTVIELERKKSSL
ncbi:MAG: PDDEXK nuclease domain-containing protein [Bacteroidales bacterium]|nr:PDDEXK nuclease domain-containing protein [Bacteroidales bacterium]